jgi:hypothetical protein
MGVELAEPPVAITCVRPLLLYCSRTVGLFGVGESTVNELPFESKAFDLNTTFPVAALAGTCVTIAVLLQLVKTVASMADVKVTLSLAPKRLYMISCFIFGVVKKQ